MGGLDQKNATAKKKTDTEVVAAPRKRMQQRFVRRNMIATASRTEQVKDLGLNRGNVKWWKT